MRSVSEPLADKHVGFVEHQRVIFLCVAHRVATNIWWRVQVRLWYGIMVRVERTPMLKGLGV